MEQSTPPKPVMDVAPPKPMPLPHESSHSTPFASSTGGGAPGAPQPLGEHDGKASASDRTRTEAAGSANGSRTDSSNAFAVHAAPAQQDDEQTDQSDNQASTQPDQSQQETPTPQVPQAPKARGPGRAITLVILAMIVLSGLAILIYLNA